MATFTSTDGTVTRVTGSQTAGKNNSFMEVQLLGGKVMLTAKQFGDSNPANVEMTEEDALKFAGAILNVVDRAKERGEVNIGDLIAEVFTDNYQAFAEVDTAHENWLRG